MSFSYRREVYLRLKTFRRYAGHIKTMIVPATVPLSKENC